MLRPTGNSREIREDYLISLPYCSIHAQKARRSKGYVFAMLAECARHTDAGWKKQSSIKIVHCRCASCASAFLGALSGFDQVCNKAPAGNITSVDCRGWCDVGHMDKTQKSTRAVWVTTLRYLVVTGTTLPILVLDVLTGTMLPLTRTTTSGRALSVTTYIYRFANATALQADHSTCGQPALSCFGKYITRFGITPSRKSKSAADFL